MFRIAVCDDSPETRVQIKAVLERHTYTDYFSLSLFPNGESLCTALSEGTRFELVILDIELSDVDGIIIGQYLRQMLGDNSVQILYISQHPEYAMELFDLRPLNFLLKPLNEAKLLRCVDEALTLFGKGNVGFSFIAQKQIFRIPLQDIRYFESCGRKLRIHTGHETYTCYQKLSDAMAGLPYPTFFRIHQSFVVHSLYLSHLQYDTLVMDDGVTLPISQPYRKSIRALLLDGVIRETTQP